MLEIRNTVTEIRYVFELIRLYKAKERTTELKDISIETSKTEKQSEKNRSLHGKTVTTTKYV